MRCNGIDALLVECECFSSFERNNHFLFCFPQQRYGMLNHVVYDVFIKGEEDAEDEEGLRGTSRFKDNLEAFSKKGLKFR